MTRAWCEQKVRLKTSQRTLACRAGVFLMETGLSYIDHGRHLQKRKKRVTAEGWEMGEGWGGENLPLLYFNPINLFLVISF